MTGNGDRRARLRVLLRQRSGLAAQWEEAVAEADEILGRLKISAEDFRLLLVAEAWRPRPPILTRDPEPPIDARYDASVGEKAARLEAAKAVARKADDDRQLARAEQQAGKGDLELLADRRREAEQAYNVAHEAVATAQSALTDAAKARDRARRDAIAEAHQRK
jgi:hypothetical protein